VLNLTAREVHTVADTFKNGHVMNEFFDKKLNKWIWVDPLFALFAKNSNGKHLSLLEIRQAYYNGKTISYQFFGNNYHYFKNKDPRNYFYFENREKFSDIMLTLGNNVFEEDKFNQKYGFLPKPIRQSVGLLTGVLPSYLIYLDQNSIRGNALRMNKYIYIGIFTFLACGTLLYPSLVITVLWKRRHDK
jgi:hypothetical protein